MVAGQNHVRTSSYCRIILRVLTWVSTYLKSFDGLDGLLAGVGHGVGTISRELKSGVFEVLMLIDRWLFNM